MKHKKKSRLAAAEFLAVLWIHCISMKMQMLSM